VCQHPARAEIDAALVRGVSPYEIETGYTGLKKSSVQRHRELHLTSKLLKAQEAREVAAADDLLEEVRGLQRRAYAVLGAAEQAQEYRVALAAIREARSNLELLARLVGQLDSTLNVNLSVNSEWIELRALIVGALEPHPDARTAVLAAIQAQARQGEITKNGSGAGEGP